MRAIFILIILCAGISLCCARKPHKVIKHHKHCHKWLILQKFYILAFLAIKFKVILVVGTIWFVTFMFGKVFAAFKLAEYMKKNYDHSEIIYSNPHHHDDHLIYGKNIDASPSSPDIVYDYPPKGSEFSPDINYGDSSAPPQYGYGRSYFASNSSGAYENFSIFFNAIKRSNLSNIVFNEMDLKTEPCRKKFVCEADYNAKQISVLETIFNLFIDDSYKKYRTKDNVTTVEDCSILNPTCDD